MEGQLVGGSRAEQRKGEQKEGQHADDTDAPYLIVCICPALTLLSSLCPSLLAACPV